MLAALDGLVVRVLSESATGGPGSRRAVRIATRAGLRAERTGERWIDLIT